MTTAARIHTSSEAQFYLPTGEPFYEVPYADPKKGMRRATLADARKVGALPGPTTILKVLAKPELQSWLIEQAVLAVLTTPRKRNLATGSFESDDDFVNRVLKVEKIQDQERDIAATRGTAIHAAMEAYFTGQPVPEEMKAWIMPAAKAICEHGTLVCSEKVLIGDGYGGRCDLILENTDFWQIWDLKSTKKLPEKGSWMEHVIQLSAYAAAWKIMVLNSDLAKKHIQTFNCYVSSIEPGKFIIWKNPDGWIEDYEEAFVPAMKLWRRLNNYYPKQ